jgi:WD40 repeat protein/predicted Ser/Thr protein kinase
VAAFAFQSEPEETGHSFGDYELLEEIARGGMGVVFKARQRGLNRLVALKMMLHGPFSEAAQVRRFQTEAKAIARLHHPNIVTIYEIGEHDGYQFLSMELIQGQNFADLVEQTALPGACAAGYLAIIAEAIHYAHQQGVVHRDLKPSNLLLDDLGQPHITDFGLAKLVHLNAGLTLSGQSLGSPGYMAPEQALGRSKWSDAQGDIYSLGAVLYHLVTGRPPFQGETVQDVLLQAQTAEPIVPSRLNPRVPGDLETICLKCLEKDPARRYTTAQELADDLRRFLADEPVRARPLSKAGKVRRWCRRRPAMTGLALALGLAVALGTGGVLREWSLARNYAGNTRLNLYAADVNLASQAVGRGDLGLARRILAGLQPLAGEEDLRGFEWRYLWGVCKGDQIARLEGHTWIVTCAAFSPDGHTLATGSQDGTARIWDVEKKQLIAVLPSEGGTVWSVGFSPDGGVLLTSGNWRNVELWSLAQRKKIFTTPGQIGVLSRRGSLLATSESSPLFWAPPGKVALWDWRTGQKLRELDRPGRALALAPDDKTLAAAGPDGNVELYEVDTGRRLRTLGTSNVVWSLAFSPGGDHLLAVGWTDEALDWDLRRETPPRRIKGESRNFWSAAFSPDGSTIATASSDRTIRLWDAATLRPRALLRGHGNEVWCVAFSPDGKTLASGGKDQAVMLWAAETSRLPDDLPNRGTHRPVFSADGRQVILQDPATGQFAAWAAAGRTRLGEAVEPPAADTSLTITENGGIRVWEIATGRTLGSLQGPKPPLRCTKIGPRAQRLVVTHEMEDFARLYEVASGREIRLTGHRDFISGAAFSPDGKTVATGSMDGTIKLWDCGTGRELAQLPGHLQETTDVAYSPDGKTLASVGHKESIKLWHIATRRELLSIDFPQAGMFVQFSRDGKHLAVTTDNDTVRFLDGS